MVGTWSTIQKQAKRTLDIIVETTGELGMFLTSMLKPQVLERGKKCPVYTENTMLNCSFSSHTHYPFQIKIPIFYPLSLFFGFAFQAHNNVKNEKTYYSQDLNNRCRERHFTR